MKQGIKMIAGAALLLLSSPILAAAQPVQQDTGPGDKTMDSKPLITDEQSAIIRTEVSKAKTKPVADEELSLEVGEDVPRSIAVHELPPKAVEFVPEYIGHKYVIVKNTIAIIDPISQKVVATVGL